ncbi:MAG: hypothetical protein CO113_01985 [Elusimicrobia bacterium CG_4_9_14_3_um_filter_62_55]|nr:MAG: hypothetical protein CO113_01985 [Elusimicrobia bacterium CG_4_9_14_3_um_filter_62_55]
MDAAFAIATGLRFFRMGEPVSRWMIQLSMRTTGIWRIVEQPSVELDRRRYQPDALVEVRGPDGKKSVLVIEYKNQLQPKDVSRVAEQLRTYAEAVGERAAPLFISPFITQRTRESLSEADISFADKTGNVRIVLSRPGLFVQTQGASSDPNRESRSAKSLKGAKAGRLVRALCDFRPPLGIRELGERTGVDAGYVSRVVSFLETEAYLEREPRGPIVSVSWRKLLERWTKDFSFQKSNEIQAYLEPRDVAKVPERITAAAAAAVTGSAAAAVAPVAPTRMVMAYVADPEAVAKKIGLRRTESGANVLLAKPFDSVVFERTQEIGGVRYAALTQVAADLMRSPGRGPEEAEALLDWMENKEQSWRT